MAEEKRQLGVEAMLQAIGRTRDAQSFGNKESFYASAAESLWWLTMLDETLWSSTYDDGDYVTVRECSDEGRHLLGMRYARNRQVHDVDVTGMQGNPLLARQDTQSDHVWLWRALEGEGVPPYTPKEGEWGKRGETVYRDALASHPILETLDAASHFLQERIALLWRGEI